MNHYTYILKDPDSNMKYIGVRSCSCKIEEDPYKGSSTIMTIEEKRRCVKTVLGTFKNRTEALKNEAELHSLFNVVEGLTYWNKAATTFEGKGFSRVGYKHMEESKQKMSKSLKGRKLSLEHRQKLCKAQKKRHSEGRCLLKPFPSGDAHPDRKYTSVYRWVNIDGNEFIGTNIEFRDFVGLKHIQNVTVLIKGTKIQYLGWYIVENITTGCITTGAKYTNIYNWSNGIDTFKGTGKQLCGKIGINSLSTVNKVIRGDRKSVKGWTIAAKH